MPRRYTVLCYINFWKLREVEGKEKISFCRAQYLFTMRRSKSLPGKLNLWKMHYVLNKSLQKGERYRLLSS